MKQANLDWKRILIVLLLAMLRLIAGSDAYASGPRWTAGSSYFTSSAKGRPTTPTAQLDAESETSLSIRVTANLCPVTLQVTDAAVGHPMAGAVVTFFGTLDEWTPVCPEHGVCPHF
jgi:hypothetical protein